MNLQLWQAILLALITLAGSLGVARYSGKVSVKVKELDVDGQAYLRADGITAGLIQKLTDQITRLEKAREDDNREHEAELAKRDKRLDTFEEKLREVSSRNHALTSFIYVVLAILRRHSLIDEINKQDVPDGIRV
jgi:hypothetical protein